MRDRLGRRGETFRRRDAAQRYGAPTWFRLGDRDLATHIATHRAPARGRQPDGVTRRAAARAGRPRALLPMSDEPVRTLVRTPVGLARLPGLLRPPPPADEVARAPLRRLEQARPTAEVLSGDRTTAELIVIAPCNPFVSVGPILALPALRARWLCHGAGDRDQPDRRPRPPRAQRRT